MPNKINVIHEGNQVEADDLSFDVVKEAWNEYRTEDGTIVRIKIVVSNIAKIPDITDNAGNPIYVVKSSNVVGISKT
ncbi:MAG: hypothetical protein JRI83_12130 [Deltaproteobacteria bacterium]|nr:hypothetical protein [Deltaproteobacteria bacterium]